MIFLAENVVTGNALVIRASGDEHSRLIMKSQKIPEHQYSVTQVLSFGEHGVLNKYQHCLKQELPLEAIKSEALLIGSR